MKKIITLIIFCVAFVSVAFAGVLRYQILKAAENPLPKDVKTLAFVYRNIDFKADTITHFYDYNGETFMDTTNYRKKIATAVYWGFRSVLEERYDLDTIPLLILDKTQGNEQREVPFLEWYKVNELCKRHNSDVLVSLDDVSIFNNYETWYDGEQYNGVANISSFHTWTVYDPMTESHLLHKTDLDSLQAHDTSYNLERLIRDELPHREEIMETVAFAIGENLGKQLVSTWETVYREYYDTGSREMREAASKVKAEKWQEALNIWEKIQKEGRGKLKARSAFNAAVVYERMGKIDKALLAIQQSVNRYKTLSGYERERAVAAFLQTILQARKREVAKLEAQRTDEE